MISHEVYFSIVSFSLISTTLRGLKLRIVNTEMFFLHMYRRMKHIIQKLIFHKIASQYNFAMVVELIFSNIPITFKMPYFIPMASLLKASKR